MQKSAFFTLLYLGSSPDVKKFLDQLKIFCSFQLFFKILPEKKKINKKLVSGKNFIKKKKKKSKTVSFSYVDISTRNKPKIQSKENFLLLLHKSYKFQIHTVIKYNSAAPGQLYFRHNIAYLTMWLSDAQFAISMLKRYNVQPYLHVVSIANMFLQSTNARVCVC